MRQIYPADELGMAEGAASEMVCFGFGFVLVRPKYANESAIRAAKLNLRKIPALTQRIKHRWVKEIKLRIIQAVRNDWL